MHLLDKKIWLFFIIIFIYLLFILLPIQLSFGFNKSAEHYLFAGKFVEWIYSSVYTIGRFVPFSNTFNIIIFQFTDNLIFLIPSILLANQDSLDYDIWNDVSWDTITHITEVQGEVEQVIAVAGVRGDEAESEILKFLWYRKRAIRR